MGYQFNPFTGNFDNAGSGGSGNPFDQSLNTTDTVQFNQVTSTFGGSSQFAWGDSTSNIISWLNTDGSIQLYDVGSLPANAPVNTILSYQNNPWFYRTATLKYRFMLAGYASSSDLTNGTSICLKGQDNSFTTGQTISPAANTSALTSSYTVTGANTTPILNLSGTWNTTGQPSAIKLNLTDTASNANSRLMDLQVGGTSIFWVAKNGYVNWQSTLSVSGLYSVGNVLGSGNVMAGGYLGFSSGDAVFYRDAAGIIAQRNGTNAQTARIYGTYTDASNGRRLDITSTTGGIFTLTATGNGTGATGNLLKLTAPILLPASSVTLATNGDLAFEATSNTTLTIRYRGSDGTTRSAALTLA